MSDLGIKGGTLPLRNSLVRRRPGHAPPWMFALAIGIFRPETLMSTPAGNTLASWKNETQRADWVGADATPINAGYPGTVQHNGLNGLPMLQLRADGYQTTKAIPQGTSTSYSVFFVFRDMGYTQNGTYVTKYSNGFPLMYITHVDAGEMYNFGGGGGQATEGLHGGWRFFYLEQTFGAAGTISIYDFKNGFTYSVPWNSSYGGNQYLYLSQDAGSLTLAYDYVESIWFDQILDSGKKTQMYNYLKQKYLVGLPVARQAKLDYTSRVGAAGGTIADKTFTFNFINLVVDLGLWDSLLFALDINMGSGQSAGNAWYLFDVSGQYDPDRDKAASCPVVADPTLNGRYTLTFNGTANRYYWAYRNANIVDSEGFYVAKFAGATELSLIGDYGGTLLLDETTTEIKTTSPAASFPIDTTAWHIAQMKMSKATSLQLGANGVLGAPVAHTLTSWPFSEIGAYSYKQYYNGAMAGLYQFKGSLTDTQRSAIVNFLNAYYGVF